MNIEHQQQRIMEEPSEEMMQFWPTEVKTPIPLNFSPRIDINKEVGEDGRSLSCHKEGGFLFRDEEAIQKQRGSMWHLIKKIGSNLLEGKDLVSVSLPVYLFEPRSFLHRICDNWSLYHYFLFKAAREKDPIRKLSLVIAFSISGLHQTLTCLKPFNPILGETYEAEFIHRDPTLNAEVFVEQISHHPPITAWEVRSVSGDFYYTGQAGYSASMRGNALKGGQIGPHKIQFKDGTVIKYELPLFWLKGVMWGERVMEYYGVVKYEDVTNNISCELVFDPDQKGFFKSLFQSAKTPSDFLRGEIKNKEGELLGSIEGSWLGYLDLCIGDNKPERLWSISDSIPCYATPKANVLPSDSRWREDLRSLVLKREEDAQKWKELLEEKQRKEKKLRQQ
jgi:hypothetical protein